MSSLSVAMAPDGSASGDGPCARDGFRRRGEFFLRRGRQIRHQATSTAWPLELHVELLDGDINLRPRRPRSARRTNEPGPWAARSEGSPPAHAVFRCPVAPPRVCRGDSQFRWCLCGPPVKCRRDRPGVSPGPTPTPKVPDATFAVSVGRQRCQDEMPGGVVRWLEKLQPVRQAQTIKVDE